MREQLEIYSMAREGLKEKLINEMQAIGCQNVEPSTTSWQVSIEYTYKSERFKLFVHHMFGSMDFGLIEEAEIRGGIPWHQSRNTGTFVKFMDKMVKAKQKR
jgi:hypothetical protein